MWMIRWFFIAVALFVMILFIMKNQNLPVVSIDYILGKTGDISPLTAMFVSFVLGFFTWFVISLFNFLRLRSELNSRDRLIRNLKDEINDYRNSSLTIPEGPDATQVGGGAVKPFPGKEPE